MKSNDLFFQLVVDGVPYEVHATPFQFNGETRFKVHFNGSPEYVFVWDLLLKRYIAIGEEAGLIPDNLEMAVSEKLQSSVPV